MPQYTQSFGVRAMVSVISGIRSQAVHPGIKKSSPEGLDIIPLYLQYLILVVLQLMKYIISLKIQQEMIIFILEVN